jgi:hypothetical protein
MGELLLESNCTPITQVGIMLVDGRGNFTYNTTAGDLNGPWAPTSYTPLASDLLNSFTSIFGPANSAVLSQYSPGVEFVSQWCNSTIPSIQCAILFTLPVLLFQSSSPFLTSPDVYNVSMEVSQSFPVTSVPGWCILVYVIVSTFILSWSVGWLILASHVDFPPTSNFEILDFASRVAANRSNGSFTETLASLSTAQDSAFRKALEDKKIFVRDFGNKEATVEEDGGIKRVGKIGFTMKGEEGTMLMTKVWDEELAL